MHVQTVPNRLRINSQEMPWQFRTEDKCQYQRLPEELGSGCSKLFILDQDFSFIETEYNPIRNLEVSSRMTNQEPRMILTLALKGCSRFDDSQGNGVVFKAGLSTLTTFNSSDGCRHYQSHQSVVQLRFSMSRHWLEQHFGEGIFSRIFNKNRMQVLGQRPISAAAIQAVQCLQTQASATEVQPLFRQGLALAIVASELNDLISDGLPQSPRISSRDRRLAESARDILQAEFANPPSVDELCRRVGTNQFKLKQLFRQCFDTTPYGMLLDVRMNKAYRLLVERRCSVGTVAEAVGYSHASNFSAAFNKHFGFPPKHLSKQI